MSYWSYVRGTITVEPMGRTQHEKEYILKTVLDHLPVVTGSEKDMNVYVVQKRGYNEYSNTDEFGHRTDRVGRRGYESVIQDEYILVVEGSLRDRKFDTTFRGFMKWLTRLAKRVWVRKVLVDIRDYYKSVIINDFDNVYCEMLETPTWAKRDNGEPNWCEYLMWDSAKDSFYPMMLGYKYFDDPDNDAEVERRLRYFKED